MRRWWAALLWCSAMAATQLLWVAPPNQLLHHSCLLARRDLHPLPQGTLSKGAVLGKSVFSLQSAGGSQAANTAQLGSSSKQQQQAAATRKTQDMGSILSSAGSQHFHARTLNAAISLCAATAAGACWYKVCGHHAAAKHQAL